MTIYLRKNILNFNYFILFTYNFYIFIDKEIFLSIKINFGRSKFSKIKILL